MKLRGLLALLALHPLACPAPVAAGPPEGRPPGKVLICHVPPGNPANRHAIEVG